jgi:hypothetical protein
MLCYGLTLSNTINTEAMYNKNEESVINVQYKIKM